MAGKKVVIVGEVYDPTLTPGLPLPEPPLGIWGPTDPRPTPPIYIPAPVPPDSGLKPEHPIYIPVFPTHPIVLPLPPEEGGEPKPPYIWPPVIWGGPIIPPGVPGVPTHPIYIPVYPSHPIVLPPEGETPPSDAHPEHPIYLPVYPTHPIVLPPEGETPKPPPDMINPPSGARGFWGYSVYYQSMVFVPYEGSGAPGQEVPPANPDAPHVEPHGSGGRRR